ncbi:MAG TPA: hypothetical protein VMM13_07085, partial [Euzebya sp.]|nr:hypothetical protein [Euzebya sp.]
GVAHVSGRTQHRLIVSTVLLLAIGATIHVGRSDDVAWVTAIAFVTAHVGVIGGIWAWVRRRLARRRLAGEGRARAGAG